MFFFNGGKCVHKNFKKLSQKFFYGSKNSEFDADLKVVTSEKIGGFGVTSTLGTWYEGVVMGVLLSLMRPPSCIEISTVRRHKSKI